MAARYAWVLNLDADLELLAGARYAPTRSVEEATSFYAASLASTLLHADDVLVDGSSRASSARGLPGRAFCPTLRALSLLRRAGAEPEPHPSMGVLRQVNSRAFAFGLGPALPHAAFVTDLTQARATLGQDAEIGDAWRIKRAFGMAGRGQRIVRPGVLSQQDLGFLRAGLAEGGVQIEPNVAIECEYAVHGILDESGSFRLGALVRQRCDPRGAWLCTEPIADPAAVADISAALAEEASRVAAALSSAGYFGPFGIDAFTYRDSAGRLVLQPRSEVNARYSMGFAVGFATERSGS
jgi:hypothetical protein